RKHVRIHRSKKKLPTATQGSLIHTSTGHASLAETSTQYALSAKTSTEQAQSQLSAHEIQRAGGLSQLQAREAPIWSSIGLQPPSLFPSAESWTDFNERTTIFCRSSPRNPQLGQPNISSALYAINMTSQSPRIRIPEQFYHKVYENSYKTTTNITPQFSVIDLHVDCSSNGITLLYRGCIKLWALYPLTKNYDKLARAYQSNAMFADLQGMLKGGKFCVQTELQALYLPPGYIHSTITLQGGLTPGIMFTTAQCLRPIAKTRKLDCLYFFVRAVILIMRSGNQTQKQEAVLQLCIKYKKILHLKPDECGQCSKP
ncbi:hypothetical protein F5B17DRAFT_423523, partial [Nemania serpens]